MTPSRAPLPPSPPRYRRITELAEPVIHRRNLHALVASSNQRGPHTNLDVYRLLRTYLDDNFAIERRPDLQGILTAVFGTFAGHWLYSLARHRSFPRDEFLERLLSFADFSSTTPMPPIRVDGTLTIPGYAPQEPAPMAPIERAEAQLYERDLQFANRTQLAVQLIQREGQINPRLFTNRWLKEGKRITRYARTPHRFATHFGHRASTLLDTTESTDRRALAEALRSIR